LAPILVILCSIPAILSRGHGSTSTVPGAGAASYTGKVVAITDGDTIKVMHAGQPERVRLWGIDCPESRQAFGTRAKQFTSQLAFGRELKVVVRDTDRNGRTVGEVILPDGRSLNHELVRAGLA
jgi:endonuclease YncB( thermonuclease family)